jgi:hypothetical protein
MSRDQLLELGDQAVRSLRRKIQTEPLYRDEFLLLRIVRPKNGTERARADLMENAKWTEGVRRGSTGGVRVQWGTPEGTSTGILAHLVTA